MPPALTLTQRLEAHLRNGHPWVFRDALHLPQGLRDGDVADLHDAAGRFVARGTVEPDSPLTFRAWTTREDEAVNEDLLLRRLHRARSLRDDLVPPDVTGFRLCHGENDHIPGLQCDLYDGVASLRTDGRLGLAWEERFVRAVQEVANPRAVVVRNPHAEGGPRLVAGHLDGEVVISEGDRLFTVDVLHGQKTGFFLDQRDNRDRIARLALGRRVLNCFAYTGGFSVAAALHGAEHVTTVDIAAPAVETAQRNFTLNDIPLAPHAFRAADAFDVLAEQAAHPGRYDLIILDPPSFAPNKKTLPRARKAYGKLNELALKALPPGGWLATASCSSHIREIDLLDILAEAAHAARRELTIASVSGAGADHPRRLGFPEGAYLNFILAWVA